MNGHTSAPRAVVIDDLLTIDEVAHRLHRHERSVRRLLAAGDLSYVAIGGRRLIEAAELAAYIARSRRRAAVSP